MAILFKASVDNVDLWRREFARRVPDVEFRIWPDYGNPEDVEYILLFRAEPGIFPLFPNLKAVLATGAGVDGILSVPDFPQHVPLARIIDDWMTNQIVQWVVHAVLHFERQFESYASQQRRGEWKELETWSDRVPRVGILGCGEIGGAAGRLLASMEFDVAGWTRTARDLGPITNFAGTDALEAFLGRSDHLVCLLPLTESTRGILNGRTLRRLPRGAYVINAARGRHIVTADLVAALDEGQVGGAFLDVTDPEPLPPDHPLWRHPKVIVTPHVAGITNPLTASAQIAENIRRSEAGEPLLNRVDTGSGY